ncbi:MAG TPA: hypothetical protein VGR67_01765 [Candidatus Polarisedimenticolia bacterium]|nr:hypothetical protein [Candidatus Polarisedimenticolia bacterium]
MEKFEEMAKEKLGEIAKALQQTAKEKPPDFVSWRTFLESSPPGSSSLIGDLLVPRRYQGSESYQLWLPDLLLHCPSQVCNGERIFSGTTSSVFISDWEPRFLSYVCKNCGGTNRLYAVFMRQKMGKIGEAIKVGEWPPFGPRVPNRVLDLLGDDRQLFLKGRGAENLGLGIGAFAYYRRVVENQKNRILDQVIQVASRMNASSEIISGLQKAKTGWQFSKSLSEVNLQLPEQLMVRGQNPLLLLHGALSRGLHEQTDEECLGLATSIRVMLTALAERIGQALADEEEVRQAVANLLEAGRPEKKEPGEAIVDPKRLPADS